MNVNSSESSTYTNAAYSNKGTSGLISGMDTESLVESMLSNIQAKIDKQNQTQQQLLWKQEMYRSIITKVNDFQNKYFNLTSKSCIRLESFFNTMGAESSSSAVSVTPSSSALSGDFKMQVAQLASAAKVNSSKMSSGTVKTSTAKADSFEYARTVDIKIGDRDSIQVDLKGVSDADEVCAKINAAVGNNDFVKVDKEVKDIFLDDAGNELKYDEETGKYTDKDGNEYTGTVTNSTKEIIKGITFSEGESFEINGSSAGLAILGFRGKVTSSPEKNEDGEVIEDSFKLKSTAVNTNFGEVGKVTGSVDIVLDGVKKSFSIKENESMEDLRDKVQKAFGSSVKFDKTDSGWEISVDGTGRQINISANADTMEAIGFASGTSQVSSQILRSDPVSKLGIGNPDDPEAVLSFDVNGKTIEYTSQDSIATVMNKINAGNAGVKITYDSLSDKFSITSQSTGTGFGIDISNDSEGLLGKLGFSMNSDGSIDQSSINEGKNAIVTVDGVLVERANNNFTYNGLTLNVKSVTGDYEKNPDGSFVQNSDGTIKTVTGTTENKAEITSSRDVDKIVETLKSFVDDYNNLIDEFNGYVHEEASYKKYSPLTEAQKKEMSEKEIELWEEKAKQGLLRNDSEVSEFLRDMRTAMYTGVGSKYVLSQIGIESSSQWSDYGKLSVDEDALKNALTKDANGVKDLFVGENGLATRLNDICTKTANTGSANPGVLTNLAGVVGKASETENTINDRIDEIKTKLAKLNELYEKRKERYWSQFNAMETALSNMSSQSTWMSQMFG